MSEFNDLFEKINDLNEKIEEETQKLEKRKLQCQRRIQILEEDKSKAGLKGDLISVRKFDAQIIRLKDEIQDNSLGDYNSELKDCKKEINNLVNDYYKKGLTIEDIFKKENTPKNIREKVLSESNFGANSGVLYVDEIYEKEFYWRYYNPFLCIEKKFKYLGELESELKDSGECYFVINEELVNKSKIRYKYPYLLKIDEKLSELEMSHSNRETRLILDYLAKIANKFDRNRIIKLCDISNSSYQIYNCDSCADDLAKILNENVDIIPDNLFDEVMTKITEARE